LLGQLLLGRSKMPSAEALPKQLGDLFCLAVLVSFGQEAVGRRRHGGRWSAGILRSEAADAAAFDAAAAVS